MHVYIYDSFVNHNKNKKTIYRIETRLTDLGLNGKIYRIGVMQSIKGALDNELKRGAKTIVAVGNDATVNQVANAIAGENIPLGIIPVRGEGACSLAEDLGLPFEEAAADVLSFRRIETFDLGAAGGFLFLKSAEIKGEGSRVEIDENYYIEIKNSGSIKVANFLGAGECRSEEIFASPFDGKLSLIITPSAKGIFGSKKAEQSCSLFSFKKIFIKNKKYPLVLDNAVPISLPAEIKLSDKKLKVIIGKNRGF